MSHGCKCVGREASETGASAASVPDRPSAGCGPWEPQAGPARLPPNPAGQAASPGGPVSACESGERISWSFSVFLDGDALGSGPRLSPVCLIPWAPQPGGLSSASARGDQGPPFTPHSLPPPFGWQTCQRHQRDPTQRRCDLGLWVLHCLPGASPPHLKTHVASACRPSSG